MARWQLTRSSAKLFKAPSSWERRRNRGWICFIWSRVSRTESGTVRKNTPESRGGEHQQHHKGANDRQQAGADLEQISGQGGVDRVHIIADPADQIPRRVGVKIPDR